MSRTLRTALATRAELVEEAEAVAEFCAALLAREGHGKATRRTCLRVNVEREPTHGELVEAVGRDGLFVVYLGLAEQLQ